MFKSGQKLLVTALALAASGAAGYIDGAITFTADNGATVEPIDAVSAYVTVAAGTTTITGAATADGNPVLGSAGADAGDAATSLKLTVTAAA